MADIDKLRNYLLNRIYEELKQANVNRYYAGELIDQQILSSKWFNVFVALFSTSGAVGTLVNIWKPNLPVLVIWAPLILSSLVAICSILNQFYPVFFLKAEDLTKLINLHTSYLIYLNRLQDLFSLTDSNQIDLATAQKEFSVLTDDNSMKVTDISRIFGKINSRIENKAVKKSDEYQNTIYNS